MILKQLYSDIFRKDAQQGVTLTYAWLANQFGHFALGFITAVGIYFYHHPDESDYTFYGAFFSGVGWFVYEAFLFTRTLIKWKRKSTSPFAVNLKFLLFDVWTDLGFFWLGSFVFYMAHHAHIPWIQCVAVGLIVVMLIVFYLWYNTRIHQQEAHLPFALNLAQWRGALSQEQVAQIDRFARHDDGPQHLLLFGPRKSAKNNLAVAIANELVSRNKRLYYVSINEFFRMLYENAERLQEYRGGDGLWNWRQCDALVVDHINPGDPVPGDIVTPDMLYEHISNQAFGSKNINTLRSQKVVWVVGDIDDSSRADVVTKNWISALQKIGIYEDEILIIQMPMPAT